MLSSSQNNTVQLVVIACVVTFALGLLIEAQLICALPSSKAPSVNEINDGKMSAMMQLDETKEQLAKDASNEQSFRKFIDFDPRASSSYIGAWKANASEVEKEEFRKKIASTILAMQEMDKQRAMSKVTTNSLIKSQATTGADAGQTVPQCYIEVTRVEKVPGKCGQVHGGKPICQSDEYMSFSSQCS